MSATVALYDELMAALAAPTPEQDQELINLGVPADITHYVGAAKVRPNGNTYEPDLDGMSAWVMPCMDGGKTCDLLALTTDPVRWWLRLGLAAYLGGDALACILTDIWVYRTPWSWLQAGAPGDGLVILDSTVARQELAHLNIVAENPDHGIDLDSRLTIPARHPQISVPARAAA